MTTSASAHSGTRRLEHGATSRLATMANASSIPSAVTASRTIFRTVGRTPGWFERDSTASARRVKVTFVELTDTIPV